jgi:DNA-binding helix-hairpin-helix protein with protein kinase domain
MTKQYYLREPNGSWRRILIDQSTKIEAGREGAVYASSQGELALKLFANEENDYLRQKREKVYAMLADRFLSYFVDERRDPDFMWPLFTVHEEQHSDSFVGFGMRRLIDYFPLDVLLSSTDQRSAAVDQRQRALISAYLFHLFTRCHLKDVIVGDVKPDNIYIHSTAQHVALVDCDSFQLSLNGVEYTSDVGTRDYSSPRLIQACKAQGADHGFIGVKRHPGDDVFALAIICFRLLMNGYHPFQTTQSGKMPRSIYENIQDRVFPYASGASNPPKKAPIARYNSLPTDIKLLFEATFQRGEYIPARRWRDALYADAKGPTTEPQVTVAVPLPTPGPAPVQVPPPVQMPAPIVAPREGLWSRLLRWIFGA